MRTGRLFFVAVDGFWAPAAIQDVSFAAVNSFLSEWRKLVKPLSSPANLPFVLYLGAQC